MPGSFAGFGWFAYTAHLHLSRSSFAVYVCVYFILTLRLCYGWFFVQFGLRISHTLRVSVTGHRFGFMVAFTARLVAFSRSYTVRFVPVYVARGCATPTRLRCICISVLVLVYYWFARCLHMVLHTTLTLVARSAVTVRFRAVTFCLVWFSHARFGLCTWFTRRHCSHLAFSSLGSPLYVLYLSPRSCGTHVYTWVTLPHMVLNVSVPHTHGFHVWVPRSPLFAPFAPVPRLRTRTRTVYAHLRFFWFALLHSYTRVVYDFAAHILLPVFFHRLGSVPPCGLGSRYVTTAAFVTFTRLRLVPVHSLHATPFTRSHVHAVPHTTFTFRVVRLPRLQFTHRLVAVTQFRLHRFTALRSCWLADITPGWLLRTRRFFGLVHAHIPRFHAVLHWNSYAGCGLIPRATYGLGYH